MISPEEFVERLCLLGADRGPRRFPKKPRDREILMKSMVMLLRSDRTYGEPEINEALQAWNESRVWYDPNVMSSEEVAEAAVLALTAPRGVEVHDFTIKPTKQIAK